MQRLAECAAFVLGTSSAEQNARSPLLRTRAIRIGLPRAFKLGVLSASPDCDILRAEDSCWGGVPPNHSRSPCL
jgi:hypothetical protein